ncbi:uncharacterized protein LOC127261725 [Andrographis paniculata]|uniref:uncharacterized protein LOC127261725 n=1 Tax=Andrographis paniculata TaxID=175694 RepID=UPI0021E81CA7|nr:uncharacterized protein LOC127261725 [Andrographis paniculata]
MCGIALIVSGIRVDSSQLVTNCSCPSLQLLQTCSYSAEDIESALRRRGPDSVGATSIGLTCGEHDDCSLQSFVQIEEAVGNGCGNELCGELRFFGATLQLRGVRPVVQPLIDALGNVLVYNGEIFGGIDLSSDSNDTEVLMQCLGQCCSCVSHIEECRSSCCSEGSQKSVLELLSGVRGPWALIYWQGSSKTLWFGRDALGRRSLLVHWPTDHDPRLLLSSVSPSSIQQHYETDDEKGKNGHDFWEELPCGVYSLSMSTLKVDERIVGIVKKHEWTDSKLVELMAWNRTSIEPATTESVQRTPLAAAHRVLMALRESIMRRTVSYRIYQELRTSHGQQRYGPVAVLFSGGLDSMIIAALLHGCIGSKYEIDLLNISFDGESAPDRITARDGLKELTKIAPSRRWNLVEIDADLPKLKSEMKHVMSLINPSKTYMDLNIGTALWLAAGGDGWLYEEARIFDGAQNRIKYKSEARILLVGSGADEQCAGYGRHKTKFRNKSWIGLHEEMKLDMQRIWKRNLGRDDRCIADNGKEARFPFLDEDVIRTLLDIPLWEIANLDQPSGVGDKKILREVARLLGLNEAAALPKRAIQFGSRIARESNRKNFGSNRAANQASAGSVVIY